MLMSLFLCFLAVYLALRILFIFRRHFSGPMFLPAVLVMSSTWGSNDIFFPNANAGPVDKQVRHIELKLSNKSGS